MLMDSMVRIYKSCIRSIMIYAIEARKDTNKTKIILHVVKAKRLNPQSRHKTTMFHTRHSKMGTRKKKNKMAPAC